MNFETPFFIRDIAFHLKQAGSRFKPDTRGPVHATTAERGGRTWLLIAVPLAERDDVPLPVFLRRNR